MKLDRRASIDTIAQTPLGRLRAQLDDAERLAVGVGMTADDAVALFYACDAIEQLLAEVGANADIRPEANRAEALRGRLRTQAVLLARLVQGAGRAAALDDSPAWRATLTRATTEQQQRQRRMILSIGGLALVLALFGGLSWLFPAEPSPDLVTVGRFVSEGEIDAALERVRIEQEQFPDDGEAALWRGVLELRAGDAAEAQPLFDQARQRYVTEVGFYFERGNLLIQVGLFDAAAADADTLIARADAQAEGYLLRGSVEEARGDRFAASEAYNRAAELAAATDKPQLEVIAKTRLGLMLQAPPIFPTPTP